MPTRRDPEVWKRRAKAEPWRRLVTMRRALLAVLVILVVAQTGCRTSREDPKDSQRVEHRVSQDV